MSTRLQIAQKHIRYEEELALELRAETRELNEYRNKIEKMMEKEAACDHFKDQLLNTVSHELRTPLTTIIGPLGIVIDELKGLNLPEETKGAEEMAALAKGSADRMLSIIENLLCAGALGRDKGECDTESQSVSGLLRKAVKSNVGLAEKYGAKVVLGSLMSESSILVDPKRFARIMANLLSNAVKYGITKENSRVTVSASRWRTDLVRIEVADNGHGIPKDFQPYVFDRFSMADSSDIRGRGGLGLGLHLTKEFVAQMKGTIGFHSILGKGTTFWICFPELKTN